MKPSNFIFTIQNNTTGIIPMQLFVPNNANDVSNARTRYRWDLSAVVYSNLFFSIQVRTAGSSAPYRTYSGQLTAATPAAVVQALNTLRQGSFWLSDATTIETYNDKVEYGDMIVGTASTTIYWQNNTLIAGGNLQIDKNAVTQVNDPNPGSAAVNSFSADNGDTIDVIVNASIGEATDFIVYENASAIHFETVPGGGSSSFSFAVNSNSNYTVQWGATL